MQQVIVFKAWEGLGDRLMVLTHLLAYCEKHGAAICVDWRDDNWGQGTQDFGDFFELEGVETVSLSQVLQMKGGITPKVWDMGRVARPATQWEQRDQYTADLMREGNEKCEGDIIITNGSGWRRYDGYQLAAHLRLRPEVVEEVAKRLEGFELPGTVVHLRGTDRSAENGMGEWLRRYEELMPHMKERVFHATDDVRLAKEWLKRVPHSKPLNPLSLTTKLPSCSKQGTHQLSAEALAYYGLTKRELILDALAEFIGMAFATDAIGLEKSTFYTMARAVSSYKTEGVSLMTRGWLPRRSPLRTKRLS